MQVDHSDGATLFSGNLPTKKGTRISDAPSNTFIDSRQPPQTYSGSGIVKLPPTSSRTRRPPMGLPRQDVESDQLAKKAKHSKSKKRKYASQPRGATKRTKAKHAPALIMELPMKRIKESLPRITFFSREPESLDHLSKELEMNGRNGSRHRMSRRRSMSASSSRSRKSFRATRKRPSLIDGPTDAEVSSYRIQNSKFVKPLIRNKVETHRAE